MHDLFRNFGMGLILTSTLIGCGKLLKEPRGRVAPREVRDSLTFEKIENKISTDKYLIKIKQSALEKEFLFQSNYIPQSSIAMGQGLKSRVVFFRERGDTLVMLEALDGHSLSEELPQNLNLATFPILERKKSASGDVELTIDFNSGMKDILTMSDMYTSDDGESDYVAKDHFTTAPAINSFLEEVKIESNHLLIRQIARVEATQEEGSVPTEIKYYLTPYRQNKNYIPFVESQDFDYYGFFEIAPRLQKNDSAENKIIKFDLSKPIVFAVSDNTPLEYRQAVKDGALYWNKAFGKEVVQVVDGPKGVRAPDLNYNVIQWVTWDDAGSAYADVQADPRTGEILHAQIYFTSVFAVDAKNKAKKINDKFDHEDRPLLSKNKKAQKNAGLCHKKIPLVEIERFKALNLSNAENEKTLPPEVASKLAQDAVRETVAHEVGHVLGLRHNFAGSMSANYELKDRRDHIRKYIDEGVVNPSLILSSSVMDYNYLEESLLIGHQVATENEALTYDKLAIQKLYFEKDISGEDSPLFCTDSHVDDMLDCKRFDIGSSSANIGLLKNDEIIFDYIYSAFNLFKGKKVSGGSISEFKTVSLTGLDTLAKKFVNMRKSFIEGLVGEKGQLRIRRKEEAVDIDDRNKLKEKEFDLTLSEIEKLGGLSALIANDGEAIEKKVVDAFIKYLNGHKEFNDKNDKKISLSDDEINLILDKVKGHMKHFDEIFTQMNLSMLSKVIPLPNNPKLKNIESNYTQFVLDIILTEKVGEELSVEINDPKSADGKRTVLLPNYKYPLSVRIAVMSLLDSKVSSDPTWGIGAKKTIKKKIMERTKKALGGEVSTLIEELSGEVGEKWALEFVALSNKL